MKLPYLGARVRLGSRLGLGWGVGFGEGVGSARVRVLAEAAVPFSIYLYLSIFPHQPLTRGGSRPKSSPP